VGSTVSGTGIPAGTTVTAKTSTTITISNATTAAVTSVTLGGALTLADNPTLYAMRVGQNIIPTSSNNTITFSSGAGNIGGGILFNATSTISPVQTAAATVTPVTLTSTLAFGANEALIYSASGVTGTINSQITGSNGLTKFGTGQVNLSGSNSFTGAITLNQGTLALLNPISNNGTSVNSVSNGQNIIINGGTLVIDSLISNNARTDSNIASASRVTGNIGSNVTVNADATITNNNSGVMQRINNLTIADLGANSPIYLNFLQNGITVTGTTDRPATSSQSRPSCEPT
jgi:autotransporter-associated beta strand protein